MSESCFEIVHYKVRDAAAAATLRAAVMPMLARYPGFRSWRALTDLKEPAQFIDLLEWDTMGNAEAAAEEVVRDPAFAAFMGQITMLHSMAHYRQDRRIGEAAR